jgi:galactoside O-acetyltransferase
MSYGKTNMSKINIWRPYKEIGPNMQIHEPVAIIKPEVIALKGHSIISEFCHIIGGLGITIGQFCHLSAATVIGGGGYFVAEDFVNVSAASQIITGSDTADGDALVGAAVPEEFRNVNRSFVHLERFSWVATNAVVRHGVTIGEGAVVGAGSVVLNDIEPWTINVGTPAKPIRSRPKSTIIELANRVYEQFKVKPFILKEKPWE